MKLLYSVFIIMIAGALTPAATLLRQSTISPGNDTGTLVYHLTESVSVLEFKLYENQVEAALEPTNLKWVIGSNTIPSVECSGSVTYRVANPHSLSADDLFVTKVKGTYTVCGGYGEEDGLTSGTNRFQYNLVGSTVDSIYIFPSYSEIELDEWIDLTAKKNSDHSNVLVKWSVDNGGSLYRSEDLSDEVSASETLTSVNFTSSETGLYKITVSNAVDESGEPIEGIEEYVHAEIQVLGEVGLEAVSDDSRPHLEPGLICLNAQPEYKKNQMESNSKRC